MYIIHLKEIDLWGEQANPTEVKVFPSNAVLMFE